MNNFTFYNPAVTASGKIQKYKMREMAVEMYNLKDAANIETA